MALTTGNIVLYTLSKMDADDINRRRADASQSRSWEQRSGFVVHVGNSASEGQVFPAFVVADFGTPKNLHVLLDGNDTYWATSRGEGELPGQWRQRTYGEVQ